MNGEESFPNILLAFYILNNYYNYTITKSTFKSKKRRVIFIDNTMERTRMLNYRSSCGNYFYKNYVVDFMEDFYEKNQTASL